MTTTGGRVLCAQAAPRLAITASATCLVPSRPTASFHFACTIISIYPTPPPPAVYNLQRSIARSTINQHNRSQHRQHTTLSAHACGHLNSSQLVPAATLLIARAEYNRLHHCLMLKHLHRMLLNVQHYQTHPVHLHFHSFRHSVRRCRRRKSF